MTFSGSRDPQLITRQTSAINPVFFLLAPAKAPGLKFHVTRTRRGNAVGGGGDDEDDDEDDDE